MTPEKLAEVVLEAIKTLIERGDLDIPTPDDVTIERPRDRAHGDWATNIALKLAKPAKRNPMDVAELIATELRNVQGISDAQAARPGFLNLRVSAADAGLLVRDIVDAGSQYGKNDTLDGTHINVEFVSANPTGPLHIGHTRWAVIGDAICRVLRASGADVTQEYYINDFGAQISKLGESILARAAGQPTPEGSYSGPYIDDAAQIALTEHPDLLDKNAEDRLRIARDIGKRECLNTIKETLTGFNIHFDVWFSETSLHEGGMVDKAVKVLTTNGHTFEQDGAIWCRTTDAGDDKDRVMVRADGEPTYFAADAAYYLSKKERGFTEKLYLLGADHHGYIARLKAISQFAGDNPDQNIEVRIGQLVSIGGARMSKRAGTAIDMADLLDWIGADAVRYTLGRYPTDSPLDLNGEDLRKQTNDNPVFYVQYAHARTCSIARNAAEAGVQRQDGFDSALLDHATEEAVIAHLAEFPRVVAKAAQLREPHRVARYLEELAGMFHRWYDAGRRIVPRDGDTTDDGHRTRLWLTDAVRCVLANGLDLLGVSAPEKM